MAGESGRNSVGGFRRFSYKRRQFSGAPFRSESRKTAELEILGGRAKRDADSVDASEMPERTDRVIVDGRNGGRPWIPSALKLLEPGTNIVPLERRAAREKS